MHAPNLQHPAGRTHGRGTRADVASAAVRAAGAIYANDTSNVTVLGGSFARSGGPMAPGGTLC